MINNHKTHGEWKIQLILRINFISSLDTGEFRTMQSKSNNVEIIMGIEILLINFLNLFLKISRRIRNKNGRK